MGKLIKVGLVALVAYVAASILFPKSFGEATADSVNALKNSELVSEIKDFSTDFIEDCKNLIETNDDTLENNNSFTTPPLSENTGSVNAGSIVEDSVEGLTDSGITSELDDFTAGILDDCQNAIENSNNE